jgi:site-specific DNA-methyltransferase (adenine-specific)
MWKIYNSDIIKWLNQYDGKAFHALLCDPPYNLDTIIKRFGKENSAEAKHGKDGSFSRLSKGFMGETWDTDIAMNPEVWTTIAKCLFPGALGLAYSHGRTYHRMATAIENAGYLIYPMIGWIYGQGFPHPTRSPFEGYYYNRNALKGALEPICLFQKERENNHISKYGTGMFNIEGARIKGEPVPINKLEKWSGFGQVERPKYTPTINENGRWPAHIIIDESFDIPFDRFFYQAKPNREEKDVGLEELDSVAFGQSGGAQAAIARGESEYLQKHLGLNRIKYVKNPHATIKSIDLNRYLATLLLPPKEFVPRRILVPFSGTGSEMIGALQAGWEEVVGIELETKTCEIAAKRIHHWIK